MKCLQAWRSQAQTKFTHFVSGYTAIWDQVYLSTLSVRFLSVFLKEGSNCDVSFFTSKHEEDKSDESGDEETT